VPDTGFSDLDEVLEELTAAMSEILGDDLVGLYLQGSFALGDADEYSDVDWIAVVAEELSQERVDRLQEMHARLYGLETTWAQHLEGSYFPKAILREVDPSRTELWFLDNGSSRLVRDNHCNTAVVRWTLREHAIVLAGPEPAELIDPVTADELRADVLMAMKEWDEWLRGLSGMSRRGQAVVVLSFCRILQTVETGTVTTKREAGEWALAALPAEWSELIQDALDDRPDPWTKVGQPAKPETLERTFAFVDYALSRPRPPRRSPA
jgi:predicted nucleotidyltransferase